MSNKPPNKPIGICPCPYRNCDLEVPVYRFRSSSDTPARERFAGKLYLICPTHRRSEDQEWISEHATIDSGGAPSRGDDKPAPPEKPVETPPADDDPPGGFGFFK